MKLDAANWESGDPVISPNAGYSAATSGYAIYSVTKTGDLSAFTVPTGTTVTAPNATTIAKNTAESASTGDTFTVKYGIGVAPSRKATLAIAVASTVSVLQTNSGFEKNLV